MYQTEETKVGGPPGHEPRYITVSRRQLQTRRVHRSAPFSGGNLSLARAVGVGAWGAGGPIAGAGRDRDQVRATDCLFGTFLRACARAPRALGARARRADATVVLGPAEACHHRPSTAADGCVWGGCCLMAYRGWLAGCGRSSRFHQAVLAEWVGTTFLVFFLVLVSSAMEDPPSFSSSMPYEPGTCLVVKGVATGLSVYDVFFARSGACCAVVVQAFMSGAEVMRCVITHHHLPTTTVHSTSNQHPAELWCLCALTQDGAGGGFDVLGAGVHVLRDLGG